VCEQAHLMAVDPAAGVSDPPRRARAGPDVV
jgi:hypothetical protein